MSTQADLLRKVQALSRYAWYCEDPQCLGTPHGVYLYNHARPEQRPPLGDWWGWFIRAGRGMGKTRSAAEFVKQRMLTIPGHRVAIIAPDFGVGRDVCIEGRSGLHGPNPGDGVIPADKIKNFNRSMGELVLTNGSMAKIFGTDTRRDAEKLRGFEFATGWFEELGTQRYGDVAWDMLEFALRVRDEYGPKVIISSTPRPTPLIKKLCNDPDITVVTGSTYANIANLSEKFAQRIRSKYEGTTLGRQELYGEILDGSDGALFSYDDILRAPEIPEDLTRIVVAVDPAGSGKANADETGIIAAGLGMDNKLYVLSDKSGRYGPEQTRQTVTDLYHELDADAVVAEKNFGGDWVAALFRDPSYRLPVKMVNASRGKAIRAEPVAMLYEQGRGVHVGTLDILESEITSWVPSGRFDKDGEPIPASTWSPGRLDALVWCATELLLKPQRGKSTMRFHA